MRIRPAMSAMLACSLLIGALGCSRPAASRSTTTRDIDLTIIDYASLGELPIDAINAEFVRKHPGVAIHVKDPRENPLPEPKSGFNGVDVVLLHNTVQLPAHFGMIREMPAIGLPPLNDLVTPVFNDLATVDEKQYGLPFWIAPSILVGVNETELSKAGIKTPPLDWTWADFAQAGSAAKRAGLSSELYAQSWLDGAVRSYGGLIFDPDTRRWGWARPEVKQALNTIAELVQMGVLDPRAGNLPLTLDPRSVPFQQFFGKTRPIPGVVARPFPRGPRGRPVEAEAFLAAIPTTAEQADLALEYIRALVDDPAVQMLMAKSGFRPIASDPKALAAWRETVGSQTAEATEMDMADLYVSSNSMMRSTTPTLMVELRPYFEGRMSLETATADLMIKLPQP